MTKRKRICARCGRPIEGPETAVYSAFSKKYYCGPKEQKTCKEISQKAKQ